MADPSKPEETEQSASEWPDHTAKLATEGDTEAARTLLREFHEAVILSTKSAWDGAPIPLAYARYLAEAFRKILDEDVEPARALGLKQSKAGRPPGGTTHDTVALAAAYWLLVRRGSRPEQANERLRSATGADRTTIQDARDACSSFADAELIDEAILIAIIAAQSALSQVLDSPRPPE